MHFIEISQFEAIPEDVLGSEKGALVFAIAVFFRDLLSLLNIEAESTRPIDQAAGNSPISVCWSSALTPSLPST
jgi:hypothetical protein